VYYSSRQVVASRSLRSKFNDGGNTRFTYFTYVLGIAWRVARPPYLFLVSLHNFYLRISILVFRAKKDKTNWSTELGSLLGYLIVHVDASETAHRCKRRPDRLLNRIPYSSRLLQLFFLYLLVSFCHVSTLVSTIRPIVLREDGQLITPRELHVSASFFYHSAYRSLSRRPT
jgi:hypothetical protein